MKLESKLTDDRLLSELGGRLARYRLDKNLTQHEVAREAGIGLRTLQRLESGEVAAQLSVFLRVCRVLGLVERLDLLVPEPAPSPMAQLKREGKRRKRASGTPRASTPSGPWKWGEES